MSCMKCGAELTSGGCVNCDCFKTVVIGPYPKARKGGTRKIADIPAHVDCPDPEHNPPNMMVFQPGIYEHECPTCGKTQILQ